MQNFGRGGGRAWGAISGAYLLLSPPGMCNHHLPSDRVLVRAPQECVFQGVPGAHCNFRVACPPCPHTHPTQFPHTKALTMASVKGHAHT